MIDFATLFNRLETDVLRVVRSRGRVSRSELAVALGARPNSVGQAVGRLIDKRLLRECDPEAGATGQGRPRRPLEIDGAGRHILGVAAQGHPAHTERHDLSIRPVNLLGRAVGAAWRGPADGVGLDALNGLVNDATLGIAVTTPGLIDRENLGRDEHSAVRSVRAAVERIGRPAMIDNDGHALAARWQLTGGHGRTLEPPGKTEASDEEVLFIRLGDGRMGASVMIGGRPNRGCVIGGNELGHTRLPVDTPRCFCGQTGCLERIASTAFVHARGASTARTLPELCSAFGRGAEADDAAVSAMIGLLAIGVSNAVQFLRPHRVVVVSEMSRYTAFFDAWREETAALLLPELRRRVLIEAWDEPLASPAESAAHLGLAAIYDKAWCKA